MQKISASITPRLKSFTGGSRRPSCSTSVAWAEKPPGTMPPMSGQWPVFCSQQIVLAAIVEGQREAHVHQVRAAEIGIVDDVDVAGLRRAGFALADQSDQLGGGILHGADEHRQPQLALADQRTRRLVVDAGGAVVGLGDDRREGRAREGDVHLVADLAERGLDHGQRDGVDGAHGPPPTAMRRLPMASTVAAAPGSITVVASICCDDGRPGEARGERQLHAVEHLRRLPAPVGEQLALADHGVLHSGRAPGRLDQRGRWETPAAGRSPR